MNKYIVGGVVALIVLFLGLTMMNTYNGWIKIENQVFSKQEVIGNTLTSFLNKATTSMGIAKAQADKVIEAIKVANETRYGGGGANGAMLWLKEQNPNMPTELYVKVQNTVEAGYSRVEMEQNENIDLIRAYKSSLETFPNNFMAGWLGFPKKWDMETLVKLSAPIMNKVSTKAMETKQMEALDFSK